MWLFLLMWREVMLTASIPSGRCNTPPAVLPVDSGIDLVQPHTLISACSVTNLPLGIAHPSASQYMAQLHLPLVCGAVLCLCPAGS